MRQAYDYWQDQPDNYYSSLLFEKRAAPWIKAYHPAWASPLSTSLTAQHPGWRQSLSPNFMFSSIPRHLPSRGSSLPHAGPSPPCAARPGLFKPFTFVRSEQGFSWPSPFCPTVVALRLARFGFFVETACRNAVFSNSQPRSRYVVCKRLKSKPQSLSGGLSLRFVPLHI